MKGQNPHATKPRTVSTHTMKTTLQILIILFLSQPILKAQVIKRINETKFTSDEIVFETDREYKKWKRKAKFYPEHFNLYFLSHTIFESDTFGNLLLEERLNEHGETISRRMYYYSNTNLLLRNDNKYVDKPKSNYSLIYRYNENNEIVESIDSSSSIIKTISVTYPEPLMKIMVTRINNKQVDSWIVHYDSTKLIEKSFGYDQNDSLYLTSENYYDFQGKRLKEITFNTEEQPISTRTFEYDSLGTEIYERTEFHSDNAIEEIKRITNSINQTKDTKVFSNGKLQFWSRTYFDNYCNEIKKEYFDNDNTITDSWENEYVYDVNGNWIEKKESKDGKVNNVIYREIEYYN